MGEKTYWFKPKRFWRWFAAYYPVSLEGWAAMVLTLVALGLVFFLVDRTSHSVSDTFYAFAPWAVIILLAFDLISFRTGEYPSWWKKREK